MPNSALPGRAYGAQPPRLRRVSGRSPLRASCGRAGLRPVSHRPALPKAIRPRFLQKRGRLAFIISYRECRRFRAAESPSRYSSEAPPPVEIWVILSPKPNCCTAAAESPPPMMVTASVSASAFATAIVPAANVRVLKHAHRAVPHNRLGVLHGIAAIQLPASSVRYPCPSVSAGILSAVDRPASRSGASMGLGNSAVMHGINRQQQLNAVLFAAFAIISLQ